MHMGAFRPLFIVIFVRRGIVDAKYGYLSAASTTGTNLILTFDGDLLIRQQPSCSHAHHDIRISADRMFLFVMFHFILHGELLQALPKNRDRYL